MGCLTWDYSRRRDTFLAWARPTRLLTRLCNGFDVLAWNTDKIYLRELAAAGVPVVPTTFVLPGDEVRLPAGDGGFVVKPSVSAGSRDTARYTADENTVARARRTFARRGPHGAGAAVSAERRQTG